MSIYTAGASGFGFVKSAGSSSWDSSGAMQGAYGSGSPRIGALFFSGLNAVNWADQSVSEIQLTLTFTSAGRSAGKNIGLYRGTKTGLWGTGSAMLGAYLGEFWSGTPAYNSTKTITFSAETYPDIFAGLVGWLNSGLHTLAVYRNETTGSGSSYSTNYLKINGASVAVTYEPLGSKGVLDRDSAVPGDTLTLTVEPAGLGGTITHSVQWTFGSASGEAEILPEGVTETSFTVPSDWLYQLPDAASGTASCILTTYQDGAEKASRAIPFTVNVPESIVPQFTLSAQPDGTSGGYWQHLGGVRLTVADASSAYGATITSIRITGSEDFASDLADAVTPAFAESGVHTYNVVVTDSRGRTAERTLEIDVTALTSPKIDVFTVERYDSRVNDAGETIYEPNPIGTHAWVTLRASVDPAGGNNIPYASVKIAPVGGEETDVAVPWTVAGSYETTADRTLLTAAFELNSAYVFTLSVSDRHSTVTATSRIEKGTAIMDVEPYGVAFGGFSTATADDPKDEFHRRAVFHNGVDGLVRYSEGVTPTGKRWIDGKPVYTFAMQADGTWTGANNAQIYPFGYAADYPIWLDRMDVLIGFNMHYEFTFSSTGNYVRQDASAKVALDSTGISYNLEAGRVPVQRFVFVCEFTLKE